MGELLPSLPAEEVRRLDRAHVIHSWSAQDRIDPPAIVSARGSRFTDHTGREYLDFASQLVDVTIGHQHPELVEARSQAAAMIAVEGPDHVVAIVLEPLVPFDATGADAAPMGEVVAACTAAGLWPMFAGNRVHVVPPCTTTADEVREGLAILDDALASADAPTA